MRAIRSRPLDTRWMQLKCVFVFATETRVAVVLSYRCRYCANTDEDGSGGSGRVWSVGGPRTMLVAPRTCSLVALVRARPVTPAADVGVFVADEATAVIVEPENVCNMVIMARYYY